MKAVRMFLLVAVCVGLAAPLAFAQNAKPAAKAADPAAKLPAPILTAFRTSYPNATIKAAAKETEDGKTVWEVESIDNGLARDLVYNADGTVVEFEEQIDPANLPAAVSAALKAKYPKATITKAEKLMKGTTLTYEMALKGAAVKSIEITPEGKIVPAAKEKDEEAEGPYKQLTDIKVGADGGWDYLAVDAAARRLYVSHATKAVVIDVDKNEVVGEIAPAPGVHGIAIAPEFGKGFVSNGRENSASIVDLKTLQITGSVKTGANPDCILYEPGHKEVYTFNGRDNSATVFDAATGDVKATIALPGKPEFAVVDVKAGRIYNNIEDTNEVVVIDTNTHAVVAKWPIAPGEGASGLAIDLEHHRLYAVAGNKLLVALDSGTGKVLSTLPIGPGVDAAAYDPATGFVFASSSDSTLTVAKADAAGKLALVQTLATPPRSRTMTLDPKTHRIYVSAAEFTAPPPAAPGAQPQRPQMVPGSFKVVVYEMTGQVAGQKPSAEWQQAFAVGAADLATVGENPYFVLKPGYQLTLEGLESGKTVRLVITVLDETRIVGGIETRVVEERESENGALVEVSRNFMAIHKSTRDIYYLGEEVDIYKNGKIVDHEGAWMHGTAGARLGLLVPAAPVVGQRYYQEVAPKVAMDRAEVVSVSERMTTPAGTFERCLKTEESTPLEPGREAKLYAPGVGLVKDASLVLISYTKR